MSMHWSMYVGPFVRYTHNAGSDDAYDVTDGRLYNPRGDLQGEDGDMRYAGPNIEMPKITRQLHYNRGSDMPVVSEVHKIKVSEMVAFIEQFEKDIAALRREFGEVVVDWGIVPGYV